MGENILVENVLYSKKRKYMCPNMRSSIVYSNTHEASGTGVRIPKLVIRRKVIYASAKYGVDGVQIKVI